jgi:CRP/FNR family cyclic AMP-dependent transcriptional regulator
METRIVSGEALNPYTNSSTPMFREPSEKIRTLAAISLARKVAYLRLTDLVDSAEQENLLPISDGLSSRVFSEGERIYPGDKREELFLIKSGLVSIYRPYSSGSRRLIKTVDSGYIFGEMRWLGQTMLGSQAEAAATSQVATLEPRHIAAMMAASADFAQKLVRHLGLRLVDAEKRHERAAFQTVTGRMASLLLELADGKDTVTGLTQQEMAEVLGVYRETVTVTLADLKRAKLIEVGRRRIRLLDPVGLGRLESL